MYYDAVLVRQSRSGWFLSFVGFEHEEPQDTVESDIVFANWAECKAMFYDEKVGMTWGRKSCEERL